MFKLSKYLKHFAGSLVIVIGLLVIQALCDLSLPDYTSKIVNIGIQQGGIDSAVPSIIREKEIKKILLFVDKNDRDIVRNNYKVVNENSEYYKYAKEELLELNTKDEKILSKLDSIMGKAILTVQGINMAQKQGDMKDFKIPNGMDIWDIIPNMNQNENNNIKKQVNEKIESMNESMITQGSTAFIKDEYKTIGINTDTLQTNYIFKSGAKMLGVALISATATVIVGLIAAKIAAGMGRNLRNDVFKKVVSFSNIELNKFSTASLITRSTNDIQQIQTLMVMMIRLVIYAPILAVGGFIKVINTDMSMAWIIGVAILATLIVVGTLFTFAIPRFKLVQNLVDKLNLVTRESLTGMLVIRAFSNQHIEEERFDEVNEKLRKTNTFVNRLMTMMMPIMMLIMNVITVLIVWFGSHQVDAGSMQVGDMMAFISYAMQIIMAFLMISMLSVIYPRAAVSANRISEILRTPLKIVDSKEAININNKVQDGTVEFKNVSFNYPDADEPMLKNINFSAKPGQTTAFIGSTGSGKSTLINLIPRFYDATKGTVEINGVDVKRLKQSELRDKIGYVPQKAILFSGTIESNISYGVSKMTIDELESVSEIAQATTFIKSKEEGYKSEISQGGTNVSGGQKQRISIARALAKKAKIYIFDDSFSALDLKTDARVRSELKSETKESTVLIVAQRISTIINADQIIVLEDGEIVGRGTHQELMQGCEVYQQIALSQLSKEELDNE